MPKTAKTYADVVKGANESAWMHADYPSSDSESGGVPLPIVATDDILDMNSPEARSLRTTILLPRADCGARDGDDTAALMTMKNTLHNREMCRKDIHIACPLRLFYTRRPVYKKILDLAGFTERDLEEMMRKSEEEMMERCNIRKMKQIFIEAAKEQGKGKKNEKHARLPSSIPSPPRSLGTAFLRNHFPVPPTNAFRVMMQKKATAFNARDDFEEIDRQKLERQRAEMELEAFRNKETMSQQKKKKKLARQAPDFEKIAADMEVAKAPKTAKTAKKGAREAKAAAVLDTTSTNKRVKESST